jgi:hypothetical protein
METKSKLLIVAGMLISKVNSTFTFREITKQADLDTAFHFRYTEYSGGRMKVLLKQNENKVDIDIHDLYSKHYGLFSGSNELLGYLRVVCDKREYYNPQVFEVGKRYDIFSEAEHSSERVKVSIEADYPFLSYPKIPESIRSKYFSLKKNNEKFVEASRLIIKEEYRGLRTAGLLIECAMVLFILICKGQKYAIVSCCKDHCSFYERYGFQPFAMKQYYDVHGMTFNTICLSTSPEHLPTRFEDSIKEFITTRKITKAL